MGKVVRPSWIVSIGKLMEYRRLVVAILLLSLVPLLQACGGDGRPGTVTPLSGLDTDAAIPAAGDSPGYPAPVCPEPGLLSELLTAELSRRGIDPQRAVSAAPAGEANRVFDLRARLVEPADEDPQAGNRVELTWTEVLVGDYNQDGVVNATDLTPLGQFYLSSIDYDDPEQHAGCAWRPSGDPDGDGAANWRLARIDGNRNGLIEVGDITPIAQHWQERLDGYRIYRSQPGVEQFTPLMDPADPQTPLLVKRGEFVPANGHQSPVRFSWSGELGSAGDYRFHVVPWSTADGAGGLPCNPVVVFSNLLPVAQLSFLVDLDLGNYTVDLTAQASYDPDGFIVSYEWDFDADGTFEETTAELPQVTHTFSRPGSHRVAVQVTDNTGGSAIAAADLFLSYEVHAAFTIDEPVGMYPHTVHFDPSDSWASTGIKLYEWDYDGDGATDLVTTGPEVIEHRYLDHGDFTAILTVTDTGGAWATAQQQVTVIDDFHVTLEPFIEKDLVPLVTGFNAVVYLAQGSVTYDWDLDNDGEFEIVGVSESYISGLFEEPGYHVVHVRARDSAGKTAYGTTQVKACLAPVADLSDNNDIYRGPEVHSFSAAACSDPDGEIVAWEWDLGNDGNWIASEIKLDGSVTHPAQYFILGPHTIRLRVTDDDGFTAESSHEMTVVGYSNVMVYATPTSGTGSLEVTFYVEANVPPPLVLNRVWLLPGDGTVKELGTSGQASCQHTYEPGNYTARVYARDSEMALMMDECAVMVYGSIPPQGPTLVVRNDNDVYPANYDALIADLDALGEEYIEIDYYPGIARDYWRQTRNPVVWYRGGPGADAEPQVYTTEWTTDEINDYIAFMRNGARLLLLSQSHGINDDAYGNPSTGWQGFFGWEILPGSIPDNDPRHPWAAGVTLEPGCASSGLYGFLKMSPRNLRVTTPLGGGYRRSNFGYMNDSAERFRGEGCSGYTPGDLEFGLHRQVCGMGFSEALQSDKFGPGFTPGVSTRPQFEGTLDMAFLSWGCRWKAPYEYTGFWPPPYSFNPGTGSLWIIGYPWAELVVTESYPDGGVRADMLQNILAWLKRDQD